MYRPPVNFLTKPARSNSLCETISASAGDSFIVGIKVLVQRINLENFHLRIGVTIRRINEDENKDLYYFTELTKGARP